MEKVNVYLKSGQMFTVEMTLETYKNMVVTPNIQSFVCDEFKVNMFEVEAIVRLK